jgi:hypothetical protein
MTLNNNNNIKNLISIKKMTCLTVEINDISNKIATTTAAKSKKLRQD